MTRPIYLPEFHEALRNNISGFCTRDGKKLHPDWYILNAGRFDFPLRVGVIFLEPRGFARFNPKTGKPEIVYEVACEVSYLPDGRFRQNGTESNLDIITIEEYEQDKAISEAYT